MQLVDKQDDLPLRLLDFFQHSLQAVFELAAIFGAREHRAQVERDNSLVLQLLWNVAGNDALRETFNDGSFAHAGFANQHRIVLGAARQHLHHATNLFIAADYGIELALPCQFRQVASVTLQRLVFGFGILIRHLLIAANGSQCAQNVVISCACLRQDLLRGIALELGHRQQQVLGRDELVLEVRRLFEGAFEHLVRRG